MINLGISSQVLVLDHLQDLLKLMALIQEKLLTKNSFFRKTWK